MNWSSARVRDSFIQYFLRHSTHPHVFVPSSSIVPKNDPSLAFVNAGMNQFKDIILGTGRPVHPRVANTQKCLRINDIDLVGTDTFHHTFFEMLGNWSFSNYFKKEACEMAWDLLINIYKLDPARLYVTYFRGDELCPADTETLNIWKSIGVPAQRILPFKKENFWAMGPLGPCGPSTEIHYDHRDGIFDPTEVNKDSGLVVEIWNLVFMQYNRTGENKLERLPLSHVVDTGAGLERLTAVLNNRVSNYDSDLFTPIFNKIQSLAKCPTYGGNFSQSSSTDYSYRVFADHMRAVTIALADGILPQSNHKIRKLVQRSIALAQKDFVPHVNTEELTNFLGEISSAVASTLSHPFPEIDKMKGEIHQIFKVENERLKDCFQSKDKNNELPILLTYEFPNLSKIPVNDLKEVKLLNAIDGNMAFKWYDSYGVAEEMVEELSIALKVKFDREGLRTEMKRVKAIFRDEISKKMLENEEVKFIRQVESVLAAEDPKIKGGVYQIDIKAEDGPVCIEWIFNTNGKLLEKIPTNSDDQYHVILTKTSFAYGNNNIQSDIGTILLSNGCRLNAIAVKELPSGWILHLVKNTSAIEVPIKSTVEKLNLDSERILGLQTSAEAVYFVKKWLKEKYRVVRFDNEYISTDQIRMEVTLLQGDFTSKNILECQRKLDKISVPLVIISKESKKKGVYNVICATGLLAEVVTRHGCEVLDCIKEIQDCFKKAKEEADYSKEELQSLLTSLNVCLNSDSIFLPFDVTVKAQETLREGKKFLQKAEVNHDLISMAKEIEECDDPYIIKSFKSDAEFSSLKKISGAAPNKPTLILVSSADGYVQGRCSIPKGMSSNNFSAEQWMNCVLEELGRGTASPPKGQDSKMVVNMKRTRIPDLQDKISQAIDKGMQYVNKPLSSRVKEH